MNSVVTWPPHPDDSFRSPKASIVRLIALILLFTAASPAQDISTLTIDDGLSQNYVYDIIQDNQGFMWFGTKDGLNRYDGYDFRVYRTIPFDSTSLSDNTVRVVFEDDGGRLWIGTDMNGVQLFDRRTETFTHVPLRVSDTSSAQAGRIMSIKPGGAQRLWIGTNIGAFLYDPATGSSERVFRDPSLRGTLASNLVNDIVDEPDTVWFATSQGLSYLVRRSNTIFRVEDRPRAASNAWPVRFIFRDSRDRLFAGRPGGLYRVHGSTFTPVFDEAHPVTIRWPIAMREAADGTLWVMTPGKLCSISGDLSRVTQKHVLEREHYTLGLTVDRTGIVWTGTTGFGVHVLRPLPQLFHKKPGNLLGDLYRREIATIDRYYRRHGQDDFAAEILNPRGSSIFPVIDGNRNDLWCLTTRGLFNIRRSDQSFDIYPIRWIRGTGDPSNRLYLMRDGAVLIGASDGFDRLDPATKEISRVRLVPNDHTNSRSLTINAFFEDPSGILWCGTLKSGLIRYDPREGTVQSFVHQPTQRGTLSHNTVLSIAADPSAPDSILWIGTNGGGLNRMNTSTGMVTYLTTDDGLPNDVIYGILQDADRWLWMSTNNGLARFDPASGNIIHYDKDDGLQSNEFNQRECYRTSDGTFYVGGVYGFNVFRPEDIRINTAAPNVVITDVRAFDRSAVHEEHGTSLKRIIPEAGGVTLEYSSNMVSFRFVALDFNAPSKNRYEFMLEGFENDWISSDLTRTATYLNLDPGSYRFRVRATNNNNVWNEEGASMLVAILPPFYMTWWFRAIVGIFFLAVGPAVYFLRVNQLKNDQRRREEIAQQFIERGEQERLHMAQELHDSLGQELLIIKNRALMGLRHLKPESKAQQQLSLISSSASVIIDRLRTISHGLRPPELDRLGLTETLRSILNDVHDSGAINVHTDVALIDGLIEHTQEINVVRILQELVSNAVKHSAASTLTVVIRRHDAAVEMEISDDGRGFDVEKIEKKHPGLGLSGIHERVRILKGTLTITSTPGNGTTTIISIPVR